MKSKEELLKLRHEAATIIEEMRSDDTKIDGSDSLNEERWAKVNADYDGLSRQIEKHERADEIAKNEAASVDSRTGRDSERGHSSEGKHDAKRDKATALGAWVKHRSGGDVSKEDRAAASRAGVNLNSNSFTMGLGSTSEARKAQAEHRAAQTITTTGGGYTIPEGFVPNLEKAMLDYGPMLQTSDVIRTSGVGDLPWPTVNDTNISGAKIAINTQDSSTAITFGQMLLSAYKYTSGQVLVPNELMEDSAFDMGQMVGELTGERVGRILNNQMTVGDGTGDPNGIATASTLGVTAAATTAITYDELINLEHSVDPAYRGNSAYMMADATLLLLRKLKTTDLAYVWNRPVDGSPGLLNGHAYHVNNDMPAATAGLTSVLFGDLSKYKIRMVDNVRLVVMNERYADYDQVGFVTMVRADGDLLNAGTNPVKHLIQAAS